MRRLIKYLYVLTGAAAAIGIVSAIGSTCVTFDSTWWIVNPRTGTGAFAIVKDFQLVWQITYFATWLAGLAWGVLFWTLRTRKTWFYPAAIITSIVGCLSRGIPAVIMTIGFFSTPRTGIMFTPSWVAALLNLAILIVLLIPAYKQGINDFIEEESASSGESVGSQVSSFAFVLFGFGIVMIAQPFIMPSHIIDGVNVGASVFGDLIASGVLQFYSGLFSISLGLFVRIAGRLINVVYSSKPSPLKV